VSATVPAALPIRKHVRLPHWRMVPHYFLRQSNRLECGGGALDSLRPLPHIPARPVPGQRRESGRIGAVAQLGERRVRNAEVRGSIPLGSTNFLCISRARGPFDPVDFRDTYQGALRELVENKLKGVKTTPREIAAPPKVGSDPTPTWRSPRR
jgi:hypothetical protein